jgi:hypothetical protein
MGQVTESTLKSQYPEKCGFCGTPYRSGGEGMTHYPQTMLDDIERFLRDTTHTNKYSEWSDGEILDWLYETIRERR